MATTEHTIEFKADFSGLCVVRPGDTLLVAMRDHVSQAQADEIKQQLRARLGIDNCAVIGGASGIAVVRSSDD